MANKKFTDLVQLTAPASDDQLAVVDTSASSSKRITIADLHGTPGTIVPNSLVAGSGTTWTPTSWTPTWTGLTTGNGTLVANYTRVGNLVTCFLRFTLGSTSSITGSPTLTLPITASSQYNTPNNFLAMGFAGDTVSLNSNITIILDSSTTIASIRTAKADSTYLYLPNSVSSIVPFTWVTGAFFNATFQYFAP